MKSIVIGAGGYLGKNLYALLKGNGFEVEGFGAVHGTGIDPSTGTISDTLCIPYASDAVVYLAQSPYYHQVPEMAWHLLNVNCFSAVQVADLSRKAEVRRFIYTSTANVYNPSFDPLAEGSTVRRDNWYSLSKVHAEEALSLFRNDMEVIIARPFGIYGPGQTDKLVPNLLYSLLLGKEIYLERNPRDPTDIDGLRISLCYIEDAVKMLYKLIIDGGPDYLNIAGDRAVSIREMVTIMAKYLKKECRFKISENYRHFDLIADTSLLKKTLSPAFTDLEDGLRATVDSALNRI